MIKEMREKSGLTQSEAAKKLKINISFWCRVESGDVDLPPKHFKKVAKLLRIPLTNLMNFRVKKYTDQLLLQIDKHLEARVDVRISAPTH